MQNIKGFVSSISKDIDEYFSLLQLKQGITMMMCSRVLSLHVMLVTCYNITRIVVKFNYLFAKNS